MLLVEEYPLQGQIFFFRYVIQTENSYKGCRQQYLNNKLAIRTINNIFINQLLFFKQSLLDKSSIQNNFIFLTAASVVMPKLRKVADLYGKSQQSLSFDNRFSANLSSPQQESDTNTEEQTSPFDNQPSNNPLAQQKRISNQKDRRSKNQKTQRRKSASKPKKKNKSQFNADQILKKLQQQHAQGEQSHMKQHDEETSVEIPDEALFGYQKKKRGTKKDKSGVKILNKFFNIEIPDLNNQKTDCEENDAEQLRKLEEQHKNLIALKNEKNTVLMDERRLQIEQKVHRIRDRLQFKNAHQDFRFKENIKKTLDNVKDCDQVHLEIQAPKIFKGNAARQTDAALLIKNLAQSIIKPTSIKEDNLNDSRVSKQHSRIKEKEDRNRKVYRKQFYEEFQKQVKEVKALDMPTSGNNIFKKSSLDQLENELEKNSYLFKEEVNSNTALNSRNRLDKSQSGRMRKSFSGISNESSKSRDSRVNSKQKLNSEKVNGQMVNSRIMVVHEDQSNEQSRPMKDKQKKPRVNEIKDEQKALTQQAKDGKSQLQAEGPVNKGKNLGKLAKSKGKESKLAKQKEKGESKDKDKINKKNKSNKKNQRGKQENRVKTNRKLKGFFEEEAEDSQNGYGDDGCSSESDDNSSIQSLIDRKQVRRVEKNEKQARKKFMKDEVERQRKIIQRIKQKILVPKRVKCELEENSESRKRRRKWIQEVKSKFSLEDGQNNETIEDFDKSEQNSSEIKNNFQSQLKDLENDLCGNNQKEAEELKGKCIQRQRQRQRQRQKKGKVQLKFIERDVKLGLKAQGELKTKNQKRGGFLNNKKAITGIKIQQKKEKSKEKQKSKAINF